MRRLLYSLSVACAALTILTAAGCGGGRAPRPAHGGDQYLIVAEELTQTRRSTNLYDAIRELRPGWFTRHMRAGDAISVYVDGLRMGNATALQRMSLNSAAEVRYLSPTEASLQFGPPHRSGPAIAVETRRRQ